MSEGRATAVGILLRDATGEPADEEVVAGFVSDLLVPLSATGSLILTVREVRAWRREREPEILRESAQRRVSLQTFSLPELLAQRDSEIAAGPRAPWLSVFRAVEGSRR